MRVNVGRGPRERILADVLSTPRRRPGAGLNSMFAGRCTGFETRLGVVVVVVVEEEEEGHVSQT